MISGVEPLHFIELYPRLKEYFDSFVDRSGGSIRAGELEAGVLIGQRQCAVAIEDGEIVGCSLSEVEQGGRICVTHCAGSGAANWGDDLLSYYEEWADAKAGGRLTIIMRPGWAKLLGDRMSPTKYRETHKVMERV